MVHLCPSCRKTKPPMIRWLLCQRQLLPYLRLLLPLLQMLQMLLRLCQWRSLLLLVPLLGQMQRNADCARRSRASPTSALSSRG